LENAVEVVLAVGVPRVLPDPVHEFFTFVVAGCATEDVGEDHHVTEGGKVIADSLETAGPTVDLGEDQEGVAVGGRWEGNVDRERAGVGRRGERL